MIKIATCLTAGCLLSANALGGEVLPLLRSAPEKVGLEIAPVPLKYTRKNRSLVGLGSYLVNAVGACNDCHTAPPYADGGDPYAGETARVNAENYLAGGIPFGPVISPNITPDENGLPAGLGFDEFRSVMRTGRDPDEPERLLQVMPWPAYANLTEYDLRAIYEYLKAIPHAEPESPN